MPEGKYHVPTYNIKYNQVSKEVKKQIDCLAENIYHEALNQGFTGWMAVGFVTMNRLESKRFGNSICEIVYQKTGGTYQFSWVQDKNRLYTNNKAIYNEILDVATKLYFNYDNLIDTTNRATFYHANYVNPGWQGMKKVAVIGEHVFYRNPSIF